jgi:TorA maturation chaperone TorD
MQLNSNPSAGAENAMNLARQSLYRFASLSLVDPRVGSWQRLCALRNDTLLPEAAALIREESRMRTPELGLGERPVSDLDPKPVLDGLPHSPSAFNAQYESTFGLLVSSVCPPYETEYIGSKFDFQRSNCLADISGFYHAFGLAISDEHPERPDHIALEFEFMAHLLELERRAANSNSEYRRDRQQICREAQSHFLKEHLAWWVPAFAKLLCHEAHDGFFNAIGVFLAALIPSERVQLNVEMQSRDLSASSPERPEACEGCELVT